MDNELKHMEHSSSAADGEQLPVGAGKLPGLAAAIDIGATSIRMAVAQFEAEGGFKVLDTLQQSVSIGRDTFTSGCIRHETVEACVQVLRHFQSVLAEYGVRGRKSIRAVATSAVREASNRDEFVDRILIATGIQVEPIEGVEVNRLTFLAVQPLFARMPELRADNLLLIEVGGGNTEILCLTDGQVNFAQTHRLGAFRVREMLEDYRDQALRLEDLLETEISGPVRSIRENLRADRPVRFLILGGEGRFAARWLLPNWDRRSVARITTDGLAQVAEAMLAQRIDELVRNYHLPFPEAETLGPALLAHVRLARQLGVQEIFVGVQNLRDGMFAEMGGGSAWHGDFVAQILHSAKALGRRYHYDRAHADRVTAYAVSLFDLLKAEHRLAARHQTILTVAALLHDIGTYISNRSHHKHSQYLIENSDVFGLSRSDLKLAALVARYHRRSTPKSTHADYPYLSRQGKLAVNKLAAILRLADALDRSHDQRLGEVRFELTAATLVVRTTYRGSLAIEKVALENKCELFTAVYGRTVVLQAARQEGPVA